MCSLLRNLIPLVLAAAFAAPVLTTGCAMRARVYGPGEAPYYTRWEHDTHRQDMDFNKRSKADQKAYWAWRNCAEGRRGGRHSGF